MTPIPDPVRDDRWIVNEHQVAVNVHSAYQCRGQGCPIHHPSDHHMVRWPMQWNQERRRMERFCPHGRFHPDPDDINPTRDHDCDGCCQVG